METNNKNEFLGGDLRFSTTEFGKKNYFKKIKGSNSRDYYNQTCRLLGLPYIKEKTGEKQHEDLLLTNLNYVNLYFLRAKNKGLLEQAYLKADNAITGFLHNPEYVKFAEKGPERAAYIQLLKRWRNDVKGAYGEVKKLSIEDSASIFNKARERFAAFENDHYAGAQDLKNIWIGAEIRATVIKRGKETQKAQEA